MRQELKLVMVLVHGFLLKSVLGDPVCPLDFQPTRPTDGLDCNTPEVANNDILSSACCVSAFTSYVGALAYHSNTTARQPLFLNATEQAACADEMSSQNLVNSTRCSFRPPLFTAYSSPCLYGYKAELAPLATGSPIVALNELVHVCANVEEPTGRSCSDCNFLFSIQKKTLATAAEDNPVNCGAALLIYVASQNITQISWLNRLFWCLEVPFTAAHIFADEKPNVWVAIFGTLLISILVVGLCGLLIQLRKLYLKRFKDDGSEGSDGYAYDVSTESMQKKLAYDGLVVSQGSLYAFSSKELMKATDNFSSKNFIGEGSGGKVYKGALPSGQLVAIKLIMNEKKLDTFYKEVENLSKVRHTNLVTLLGYCQTPNEHLLVYEYCSKGNLWEYLFGNGPTLTWEQRINIAVGSARGIWYLHQYPEGSIVHRDIKPTNILLNEHMEAKVSDFGLSRFIALDESQVFTEVKGTAGYLDPEYLCLGTLTLTSDVYGFGIVLLELISGRRPIELSLNLTKRLPLVKQANLVLEGREDLSQLVDPRLEDCYSEMVFRKMTEVAVHCTLDRAALRPCMSDVLQELETVWRVAREETSTSPPLERTRSALGSWSQFPTGSKLWCEKGGWDTSMEFLYDHSRIFTSVWRKVIEDECVWHKAHTINSWKTCTPCIMTCSMTTPSFTESCLVTPKTCDQLSSRGSAVSSATSSVTLPFSHVYLTCLYLFMDSSHHCVSLYDYLASEPFHEYWPKPPCLGPCPLQSQCSFSDDPAPCDLKEVVAFTVLVYFFLINVVGSLFFSVGSAYAGKTMCFKDVIAALPDLWKGLIVTGLWGYVFFIITVVFIVLLGWVLVTFAFVLPHPIVGLLTVTVGAILLFFVSTTTAVANGSTIFFICRSPDKASILQASTSAQTREFAFSLIASLTPVP